MSGTGTEENTISKLSHVIAIFSRIINSITVRSDHFNEIKNLINYLYNVRNWSILRLDDTTNQLFFTVLESETGEILKQIPIRVGDGVCGRVASTGQYEIINKVEEKHSFTKSIDDITHFETQSIVAVPVKYSDKVVGVLELINVDNPEDFEKNSDQFVLLQTIANFIGVVFCLSSTHQEIIFSSERDSLTGLHNRFFLEQVLDDLAQQSEKTRRRYENEVLVVMADLNNFKNVNDTYGHLVGDQLLKETASLLMAQFRKDDLIIRYGGDEFIIIINPEITIPDTLKIIRKKLNQISVSLPYDCSLAYGVAHGKTIDFKKILDMADKSMYIDKRNKNNQ